MDSSILNSLIDADIDALLRKVSLLGDGETPALVSGLLLAARRLLGGPESVQDDSEESEESKSISSAAPAASNGESGSQSPRPRRNLRAEMAGPLPALGGSRADRSDQAAVSSGPRLRPKAKAARKARPVVATTASSRVRRVSSDGLSGGEPDEYDVITAEPDRICSACNGYFGTHPLDHNMPSNSDGLMAVVLCDGTRCYTQAGDMD